MTAEVEGFLLRASLVLGPLVPYGKEHCNKLKLFIFLQKAFHIVTMMLLYTQFQLPVLLCLSYIQGSLKLCKVSLNLCVS